MTIRFSTEVEETSYICKQKRNMKNIFMLLMLLASLMTASAQQFADYVNPFIGASTNIDAAGAYHGLGKTFPGSATRQTRFYARHS